MWDKSTEKKWENPYTYFYKRNENVEGCYEPGFP